MPSDAARAPGLAPACRPTPRIHCSFSAAVLLLALAACHEEQIDVGVVDTPDAPADEVLRFVAVGDTGKGNDVQRQVAAAMRKVCEARGGCRFALLLGDNVYQDGPTGPDDPQRETKFEAPYRDLAMPFYAALGNHDYGADGAGWEFWKAADEVAWTAKSAKWRMPARHYAFTEPHADFFALDTNALFWGFEADQEAALQLRRQSSKRPWRIAFGHHPFFSNGRHGDAGGFDGVPAPLPGSGSRWRDFFDRSVCEKFDVYLAGHDHTLQDLGEACGVTLIVSGAGSSPTPLARKERGRFSTSSAGFALLEVTASELTVRLFDADGKELHHRTRRHEAPASP